MLVNDKKCFYSMITWKQTSTKILSLIEGDKLIFSLKKVKAICVFCLKLVKWGFDSLQMCYVNNNKNINLNKMCYVNSNKNVLKL